MQISPIRSLVVGPMTQPHARRALQPHHPRKQHYAVKVLLALLDAVRAYVRDEARPWQRYLDADFRKHQNCNDTFDNDTPLDPEN